MGDRGPIDPPIHFISELERINRLKAERISLQERIAKLEAELVASSEAFAQKDIERHNRIVELERELRAKDSATLEKVCAWAIKHGLATGHGDDLDDLLAELGWQVDEMQRKIARKALKEGK